jgi:hypothetical protein
MSKLADWPDWWQDRNIKQRFNSNIKIALATGERRPLHIAGAADYVRLEYSGHMSTQ